MPARSGRCCVYFSDLHADHLGTPRRATDQAKRVVWRWESDAFGTTAPEEDPDRDGRKVTVNLRFPGQYFDSETGLHYNYFRDYDPGTGRYVQGDPIGIWDDVNPFVYVSSKPLVWVDNLGLGKVGTGIKWSKKAWNHVTRRHVDRDRFPSKGKFCDPCDIKKNAEKTVKNPDEVIPQSHGRVRYERDFDKEIGTKGETGQAVVVDKHNNIVTTFPISRLSVPGANLGAFLFGNSLLADVCDFFNPLSDIQNVVDLFQGSDGDQ